MTRTCVAQREHAAVRCFGDRTQPTHAEPEGLSMNHLLHTRRRVVAAGAAGMAGMGLLFTGVANAASSGPSTTSAPSSVTAPSAGGQAAAHAAGALKEIRQQLKAGATHGTVTVTTKKGSKSVTFERGTVREATTSGFTVAEPDGTTQTWVDGPKMKIRERGQNKAGESPTSPAIVSNGENVIVVGVDTGSTSKARLVIVVPATKRGAGTQGATPGAASPSTET
jgi:hypothetical protein